MEKGLSHLAKNEKNRKKGSSKCDNPQFECIYYFVPVNATPFTYSVCPFEMICDASPEKLVT